MPPKRQQAPAVVDDDDMDTGMDTGFGGQDMMSMAKYMNTNFSAEFMASLPEKVRQRAQVLLKYHEDYEAQQKKLEAKEASLRVQFERDVAHLFARRREIVTGTGAPVSDEEVAKGQPEEHKEKVSVDTAGAEEEAKGLPSFWLRALSNHLGVSSLIEEHDMDVLEHLVDITCESRESDYGSMVIHFHFDENEYFANDKLTLEMVTGEDGAEVKRTAIAWKPGKDVTVEVTKKKQVARGSGKVRFVTREVPRESFFNIFKESDKPSKDDDEADEEEDDVEQVISLMAVLFNNVVPNAVKHYTGEAPDGSSDVEEMDEEEEEEEEESDDEEMAMHIAAQARRGGRGGRGGRGF